MEKPDKREEYYDWVDDTTIIVNPSKAKASVESEDDPTLFGAIDWGQEDGELTVAFKRAHADDSETVALGSDAEHLDDDTAPHSRDAAIEPEPKPEAGAGHAIGVEPATATATATATASASGQAHVLAAEPVAGFAPASAPGSTVESSPESKVEVAAEAVFAPKDDMLPFPPTAGSDVAPTAVMGASVASGLSSAVESNDATSAVRIPEPSFAASSEASAVKSQEGGGIQGESTRANLGAVSDSDAALTTIGVAKEDKARRFVERADAGLADANRPKSKRLLPIVAVAAVVVVLACVFGIPALSQHLSNQIDVPYTATYVDAKTGSEVSEATSGMAKNHTEVSVEAPAIEGYKLFSTVVTDDGSTADMKDASSVTLAIDEGDEQGVVFSYAKEVLVPVKYVDAETGEAVADDGQTAGLDGQTVTVDAPKIKGYKFKSATVAAKGAEDVVSDKSSVEVKLDADASQVVTFAYAKKVSYTVKHLGTDNATVVAEKQTETGYSGDTITAEVATKLAENYYRDPSLGTTQELTLQNDESKNVVVFNYAYNAPQVYTDNGGGGGDDSGGGGGGDDSGGGGGDSVPVIDGGRF